MTNDEPDHLALTRALRWCSNLLCLWGLCGRAACRRAWRCKGEPRECLARYAPLVPPEAREGAKAMLEGLHLDLRYDDVRDDAPDEIAAIEDWMARVERSARWRSWETRGTGHGHWR